MDMFEQLPRRGGADAGYPAFPDLTHDYPSPLASTCSRHYTLHCNNWPAGDTRDMSEHNSLQRVSCSVALADIQAHQLSAQASILVRRPDADRATLDRGLTAYREAAELFDKARRTADDSVSAVWDVGCVRRPPAVEHGS